jgi:hypothetical protein
MEHFYLSLASSAQHKTAITLQHPDILINYMTKLNKPPQYTYKNLFIDSGGFHSSLKHGHYTKTDEEYLEYIEQYQPRYFALRDYPCEPELLKTHNRTVKDHIHMTLDNHLKLFDIMDDYQFNSQPIPVLQGWEIEDYLYCLDMFNQHGLINDYVAVGSVCRRNADKDIKKVFRQIRTELPSKIKLHGFGVKFSILRDKEMWDTIYSVDSGAFDYAARMARLNDGVLSHLSWEEACIVMGKEYVEKINYLRCKHEGQGVLV